jgi:hypothetical protein
MTCSHDHQPCADWDTCLECRAEKAEARVVELEAAGRMLWRNAPGLLKEPYYAWEEFRNVLGPMASVCTG